MRSISHASPSETPQVRRRALGAVSTVLAALAAGAPLGSCALELPEVPFRCDGDSTCPEGFRCVTNSCIRNGVDDLAILLSTAVTDGEAAFSLHPDNDSVFVCWNQPRNTRDPVIYGATLDGNATIRRAPEPLYTLNQGTATVLLGVTGSCTYRAGRVVVADLRQSAADAFTFRLIGTTTDGTGGGTPFYETPPFSSAELYGFSAADVDGDAWYVYAPFVSAFFKSARATRRIILPGGLPSSMPTMPELFGVPVISEQHIRAVELTGGTGGAWFSLLLGSGGANYAWVDRANAMMGWIASPETDATPSYPLAVRGNEVAIAYRVGERSWRLWWVRPTGGSPDGVHSGSEALRGPMIDLGPDVVRPGGFVDGDRLVVAGASNADCGETRPTNDACRVRLWSVPWPVGWRQGDVSMAALTEVGSVRNLTRISPRRLTVTRTGNRYVAVWSAIIPENQAGNSQFTALYTGSVAVR